MPSKTKHFTDIDHSLLKIFFTLSGYLEVLILNELGHPVTKVVLYFRFLYSLRRTVNIRTRYLFFQEDKQLEECVFEMRLADYQTHFIRDQVE